MFMEKFTIAIHGGAGTIHKENMSDEQERDFHAGLQESLDAGYEILERGGSAVDAVEAAVKKMEDNELFNAGKGSVFTHEGRHEMDASIMDGATLKAGAVAGIQYIRNPVSLAKEIMLNCSHVFLGGDGAFQFALKQGLKTEPLEYFFSQYRYDQLAEIRDTDSSQLDHSDKKKDDKKEKKMGTVGAVALDKAGNLAAATSTGGLTNKRYGRIGDTPVIGAGNYANNNTCAVSCTGTGEVFIRAVAAYDVSCLVEYKGFSLEEACDQVVMKKLKPMEGDGGLIAIDRSGKPVLMFNSEGMYRGVKSSDGENHTAIFK
jgi:L-asparaginase / beta-aspartyl-peptidase